MIAASNRILIYVLSALVFLATGFYAYTGNMYVLAVPFIMLLSIVLLQHPVMLLYILLAAIPWSFEIQPVEGLALTFPDEPFMILSTLAGIMLLINHKSGGRKFAHPLILFLAIQWLWAAVTVVTSTEPVLSTKYLLAKSWFLGAFILFPLHVLNDKKIFKRSVSVLFLSMMGFMFLQLLRHGSFNWSFESVNTTLEPFYVTHVDYSALLVFMVPIQLAIFTLSRNMRIKYLIGFLLLITLIALYFSYGRGSWLALIAGIISYWLVRKRLLVFSFLVFIAVCISAILWLKSNDRYLQYTTDYNTTIFHTDFRDHLVATYRMKDVSTAERFHRWIAGVRMTKDSWMTGFGPSTFYRQYKAYTIPAFKTWVSVNREQSTVHNYFLLMIIEQGVIGLLLFVGLLVLLFHYAQKIYHRATDPFWKTVAITAAIILVMQCVINFLSDMIETDKAGSVFYLCVAAMIMADWNTQNDVSKSSSHV